MRIDRVELREVSLGLKAAFATSFGSVHHRRILLVRVLADGVEGWGECAADHAPDYSAETVDTAWVILEKFAVPLLVKHDLDQPAQVVGRLSGIRGNPMAKAALEAAAWDLLAKARRMPLWKLLGGVRRSVPTGVSIGLQPSRAELLEAVADFLARGYLRIKLKIAPDQDLAVLEAVREGWPHIRLTADANGAYRLQDAARLAEMDAFHLEFLEQPLAFDDLSDHARLAGRIRTPICLDESIRHAADARAAIESGASAVL
ncbi:MAG: o-succinylbenzoate synthase, partial [Actinomycetota bacterium]|nr:o-succinylbenzoate synthase [Actinomycetota bacterium]